MRADITTLISCNIDLKTKKYIFRNNSSGKYKNPEPEHSS